MEFVEMIGCIAERQQKKYAMGGRMIAVPSIARCPGSPRRAILRLMHDRCPGSPCRAIPWIVVAIPDQPHARLIPHMG